MHNKPKTFLPNEMYDMYDENLFSAYTEAEMIHKTNWEEKSQEDKMKYLKRLQDEGFTPVPQMATLEHTLDDFKKMYDKQVKDGTLNEIPLSKDLRKPEVNKQNRTDSGVVAEKSPPKKHDLKIRKKPEVAQVGVMSEEEQKTKFSIKNVFNYLKAEQSLATQGPVSLTVFEERKAICGECPHRKTHEQIPDELGFCTKCGCGANPRARLTNKIKMPQTSCPLDKWGTSTGIYKGVAGKLKYKLTPKSKREKLDYT